MAETQKKPFHEVVAEKLIEQLKQGTAPWQRPWEPGEPAALFPFNPTTGNRYKGINAIFLMAQPYDDQRWMTYRQAVAAGAQVRKGEHGTPIQYWKFHDEIPKTDVEGRQVLDAKGEAVLERVSLERPRVFHAVVFNAEQIDGLPAMQRDLQDRKWTAVERAEAILAASGATIKAADRAYYRPGTDSIHLPERSRFPTADSYYATALHELGHWTGHESRLARDLSHPFGSEGYAKEELRAEIASMILGDDLGIGHDPGQHAAYVRSWITVLENDPLEIFRAAADAEKIHGYVLDLEQQRVQDQTATLEPQAPEAPMQQPQQEIAHGVNEQEEAKRVESAKKRSTRKKASARRDSFPIKEKGEATKEDRGEASSAAVPAAPALTTQPPQLDPAVEAEAPTPDPADVLGKTFLDVPYKEKDAAKALGAKWDRQEQSWFVPATVDPTPFARWVKQTPELEQTLQKPQKEMQASAGAKDVREGRQYLAVPYEEREAAKAAGAHWDKVVKSWYVGPQADEAELQRWAPDSVRNEQEPAMPPREEFAQAMRDHGLVVEGDHPIMDGNKHRVAVTGGKKGATDGFYVLYPDGHPAGRIINHKTGADVKWKSKGYALTPEQKAALQAEAAATLARRAATIAEQHEQAAIRVSRQLAALNPIEQLTPYLAAKGVQPHAGVFTDREQKTTFVPAIDADNKMWSMQYIREDGTKRFAKDSRKEGCFHPVGGLDALAKAPAIVIGEGYATAATLSEVLGYATVAAFDSGNLEAVAKALHTRFPDTPIVIAGDDDRHVEATQGVNPGRVKAEEAAKSVGGCTMLPIFAPGEQAADPRGFTDFNDLATKSVLGGQAVARQAATVVDQAISQYQERARSLHRGTVQEHVQQPRQRRSVRV